MLTRYGTDNILILLGISLLLLIISYFIPKIWLTVILASIGIIIGLFTLWFFRDPDRNIPQEVIEDESFILAPADGKVVEIIEEKENDYLGFKPVRISIFLSPLDVHVNRIPVTGVVEYYNYFPGDYLVAYHPKSSELNEQSRIGVSTKFGKVLFKQICGIMARRLVCELKVGDSVKIGDRFGMMKFGSRMDILVDPSTEFYVKVGQHTVAGETIIGKLKKL